VKQFLEPFYKGKELFHYFVYGLGLISLLTFPCNSPYSNPCLKWNPVSNDKPCLPCNDSH
jgi:hypothetical protein